MQRQLGVCARPILTIMLILSLAACGRATQPTSIVFSARLADQIISCEGQYESVSITDLRFYVSDPALLNMDGEPVLISMPEDSRWQQPGLALIDMEDASGHCRNGTPTMNAQFFGSVPEGDYRGLTFTIGVPFEMNHSDPLTAKPPLDDSSMHWHWRSGYKFLRIGVANETDNFWMHLGSAGCEGTVQNIKSCRHSNRLRVSLPDFRPGDHVLVNLDALLESIDLADGVASNCSSGPAESSCRDPFLALGLNFTNGETTGSDTLFRTGRR